ncbi:hypothetical protein Asulf_00581 [Archaeoglobus sulfaticallidus PM70-1]|uniref:Methyltransferase type 11 domain-containing protein n=1 Tax=Archaeoglobus sulfaticallidus PM70-1 TaxID=387631 RepID=N0BJF6_9EURY|nr:methyltransferase domain-containing protein [Archaeoglobus sulfaticallidus]AGK60601.1 hypothetical protein Asulf_00581 [Archaeoglobus sulfaticallidus PM70-1]
MSLSKADGRYLSFKNDVFDYVYIIPTLCFAEEPEKIIKEARRALKKNGKLVLGIITSDSELGKEYIEKGKRGQVFYSSAKFYLRDSRLKVCGFKIWQGFSLQSLIYNSTDTLRIFQHALQHTLELSL